MLLLLLLLRRESDEGLLEPAMSRFCRERVICGEKALRKATISPTIGAPMAFIRLSVRGRMPLDHIACIRSGSWNGPMPP